MSRLDDLTEEDFLAYLAILQKGQTERLKDRGFKDAPLENSNVVLLAHGPDDCKGPACSLHNRSDHHMRSWPQHWRADRGIMERICYHYKEDGSIDYASGHPDPDDYKCNTDDTGTEGIHGCDGCCHGPFSEEMERRWAAYCGDMEKQEDEVRQAEIAAHEDAWWEEVVV